MNRDQKSFDRDIKGGQCDSNGGLVNVTAAPL